MEEKWSLNSHISLIINYALVYDPAAIIKAASQELSSIWFIALIHGSE